eukprot:94543-Rhodomonas_salina.7
MAKEACKRTFSLATATQLMYFSQLRREKCHQGRRHSRSTRLECTGSWDRVRGDTGSSSASARSERGRRGRGGL